MHRKFIFLLAALFIAGCATKPHRQISPPPQLFPADAFITQRGVLTVLKKLGLDVNKRDLPSLRKWFADLPRVRRTPGF